MGETGVFRNLRGAWEEGLDREVFRAGVAYVILCVMAFAACMVLPDLRARLVEMMLDAMGGMDLTDRDGGISAAALFFSNTRACAMIMLYGMLPFICLPALSLGVNAMLLGILAAWYVAEGIPIYLYFALLIPHGVFELPALVLAFGMGLFVGGQITRRCRGDKAGRTVWSCLLLCSHLLVAVLTPMLALAALIEAQVTPRLAALLIP